VSTPAEKLATYKKLIHSSIDAMNTEKHTGQQTFELHWKNGVLVDCYQVTRGKLKKVIKFEAQ